MHLTDKETEAQRLSEGRVSSQARKCTQQPGFTSTEHRLYSANNRFSGGSS